VFSVLLIPAGLFGTAIGMIISSALGELTQIVDVQYVSGAGNIFSIFDMTISLSFTLGRKIFTKYLLYFLILKIGPAIGGYLVRAIGFDWLMYSMAFLSIMYAPLLLFVRKSPSKFVQTSNEQQVCVNFVSIVLGWQESFVVFF
jgi:hypothetical protein